MRVLVDGRMLLGRFSGVARVVTQLVDHLARRADVNPVVLCGNEPYRPWVGRADIELLVTDFSRGDRSPFRRLLWEQTRLSRWVQAGNADVFHATWNSGVPGGLSNPTVLTIHDLIPWAEPVRGLRSRLARACYRWSVSRSARRATLVTAVSRFSRDAICQTLGLDVRDVLTVHNGVSIEAGGSAPAVEIQTGVNEPYVLYVGGHERRKNIAAVFRAMRAYWGSHDRNLTVALTGTSDALCAGAREEFQSLPEGSRVRFLGFPPDAMLDALYRRASALVMLSTNEGFGLPVLEAMARGCPVVAANRASLPEVAENAAVLVEPEDAEGVAAAIHSLVVEGERRSTTVAAGLERANRLTWEHCCGGMIRAYELARRRGAETSLSVSRGSLAPQETA